MKYLTENNINNYLINNYGYNKHNTNKLLKASRETAKQYKVKSIDIFFFMIENEPIKGIHTHSYGFNTSEGREVKNTFKNYYNN
tara:strand:+ start:447 stop:698 length:252 start_codon:yes stop_codon:yes gene_type:complete